jgi:hypothetical protein
MGVELKCRISMIMIATLYEGGRGKKSRSREGAARDAALEGS